MMGKSLALVDHERTTLPDIKRLLGTGRKLMPRLPAFLATLPDDGTYPAAAVAAGMSTRSINIMA